MFKDFFVLFLPMPLRLKAASSPSGMSFQDSAISLGKPGSTAPLSSSYLYTQDRNMHWFNVPCLSVTPHTHTDAHSTARHKQYELPCCVRAKRAAVVLQHSSGQTKH